MGLAQGIAPTLIVGRVASGHARPDDTWKESVLSSLHFGAWSRAARNTQEETTRTVTFRNDLDLESRQTGDGNKLLAAKEVPLQCV